jgi:hypothetical protein
MCEPFTIAAASFAIGAAQSVSGFLGASQQAKAQTAAYEQNRKNAIQSANDQYAATNQRIIQERASAAASKQDALREQRAATATAKVAAGEAGTSGLSVDALLADYDARTARYTGRVDDNLQATEEQLLREESGIRSNAVGRINSVQPGQKPSFFDAGLRILGQGLDSYGSYQKNTGGSY